MIHVPLKSYRTVLCCSAQQQYGQQERSPYPPQAPRIPVSAEAVESSLAKTCRCAASSSGSDPDFYIPSSQR